MLYDIAEDMEAYVRTGLSGYGLRVIKWVEVGRLAVVLRKGMEGKRQEKELPSPLYI